MSIGLLDPALFLDRPHEQVIAELDAILNSCRTSGIRLVPLREYWPDLWRQLGRPLESRLAPKAQMTLREIRKLAERHQDTDAPRMETAPGAVWRDGFEQLFGSIGGISWAERMAAAALRAVAADEDVILFVRKIEGRNLLVRRAAESTLDEITRWVLHVQSRAHGRRQILCVHHPRNIPERWTSRFDWRLPSQSDGAGYPFCPPEQWWKRVTAAFKTVESKPCWIDKLENGWARPNIKSGSGGHWDVFIRNKQLADAVGLSPINVVQHGAPRAGWIDHVPTGKAGRIDENKRGWTCS